MYVLQNGNDDDDDVSERTIVKFMDKLYGRGSIIMVVI